jgi:hypothetical protein
MSRYGEPWEYDEDEDGPYIHPHHSKDDMTTIDVYGPLPRRDNKVARRLVLCLNALAGVPDRVLSPARLRSDEVAMALAVLRGDRQAAMALADRLIESGRLALNPPA